MEHGGSKCVAVTDLTSLERAVLAAISDQLPSDDRAALIEQIANATVERRENTGAGFYTRFNVTGSPGRRVVTDTKRCHVEAKIGAIDHALGFILWMVDGRVNQLEGYTLALDSTAGMDLNSILSSVGGGGIGGAIIMAIVGLIKAQMAKA